MKFPTPGGGGDRSIPGHPAWTSGNQSACSVIKLRSEQEAFAVLSGWDRKYKSRISKKKKNRLDIMFYHFPKKKLQYFCAEKFRHSWGSSPNVRQPPGLGKVGCLEPPRRVALENPCMGGSGSWKVKIRYTARTKTRKRPMPACACPTAMETLRPAMEE